VRPLTPECCPGNVLIFAPNGPFEVIIVGSFAAKNCQIDIQNEGDVRVIARDVIRRGTNCGGDTLTEQLRFTEPLQIIERQFRAERFIVGSLRVIDRVMVPQRYRDETWVHGACAMYIGEVQTGAQMFNGVINAVGFLPAVNKVEPDVGGCRGLLAAEEGGPAVG